MKIKLLMAFLLVAAAFSAAVSVIPSWRRQAQAFFFNSDRKILAKVVTPIDLRKPEEFLIFKIQQNDQLFVEVYKKNSSQEEAIFLTKILLAEKKDAFVNFQGNATNLAVSDMDRDGILEIIIPSYDNEVTPRLNIYKYNESSGSFDRLKSESL
jgi:hypothetical protein